jgi:DNA-binding NarL/FixJ family response regulator
MGSGEADARPPQVRVLVVDDHALVRDSLRRALGAEPDLDAVGTTGTLAGAAELIHTLRPDVVLLDNALPDGRGAHAVDELVARHREAAVVLLTATLSLGVARAAVTHGAAGVVTKTRGVEPVLDAVRAAARGDAAVAPELLQRLLGRASRPAQALPPGTDKYAAVDLDLLARLAAGATLRDAAIARDLADDEVHALVARAADALGGRSTLETLTRAAEAGLLVAS